jgi:acyl-CoA synthetase (AMP-forming)/AMP-acid ligase II
MQYLQETGQELESDLPGCRVLIDLNRPDHRFLSWDRLMQEHVHASPGPRTDIHPDDVCLIVYTSGTTGRPKGVATRHGAFLGCFLEDESSLEWPGDRIIVNAPFSHMYGQYNMVRCLVNGMCQVFFSGAPGDELPRLIRRENISLLSGPPSLFQQLLMTRIDGRNALHGVRKVSTGGAPPSEQLIREMSESGVQLVQVGYGLTEYPRVCRSLPEDSLTHLCTTVGGPLPGTSLKLIDAEGREVPASQVGEILVKGFAMMQGYLGEGGRINPAVDADGWFHTGDLGRILPGGFLQIVGRKKEMFISHGFNVYPAEVENLLLKSGLLESVAVIGRPSRLGGEEGIAIFVPKKTGFELSRLRSWVHRNLADYKVPVRFIATDALPLNASGKIDKLALKARYIR